MKKQKSKKSLKSRIKTYFEKRKLKKFDSFYENVIKGFVPPKKEELANSLKLPKPRQAKIHRKLTRTFKAITNKKEFKPTEPILKQSDFKKLLKANIEKQVNTGNFKKAKELLPIFSKLIKGKITPTQQRNLEAKGVVGVYTVEEKGIGYTVYRVYNKFKLDKIMPNESLTTQQYNILKNYLGYSARTIKKLKERQFIAETTPVRQAQKNIEQAERDFKMNGISWSGSADFDTVISYMGGFAIAISKYTKVVVELAQRYGVSLDDLITEYLPYFAD